MMPPRHAGRLRRSTSHPRQGRSHLAPDAQQQQVPRKPPHGVDGSLCRPAEPVLQLRNIGQVGWQLHDELGAAKRYVTEIVWHTAKRRQVVAVGVTLDVKHKG